MELIFDGFLNMKGVGRTVSPLNIGKDLILHLAFQLENILVIPIESRAVDTRLLTDLRRGNVAEWLLLEQCNQCRR